MARASRCFVWGRCLVLLSTALWTSSAPADPRPSDNKPATSADKTGSQGGWEQISDEDGIIVYQRHELGSRVLSLRGQGVIAAVPQVVFATMSNNDEAQEWVPLVVARSTVKELTGSQRIEYTHVSPPWPVADRYFINVLSVERRADGSIYVVVQSAKPAQIEPSWLHDNMVLGELLYSDFTLTPTDGGRHTHLSFTVQTDPKGVVPKFLVNIFQRSWPRDFVLGLRRQMQRKGLLEADVPAH